MSKKKVNLPDIVLGRIVRLSGTKRPRIAFGCGAVKVSEATLNEAIKYIDAKSKLNSKARNIKEQISNLDIQRSRLVDKLNKIGNSVPKSYLIRRLNETIQYQIGRTLDDEIGSRPNALKEVKSLKLFFKNK